MSKDELLRLSPLERAKAKYRPLVSIDELVGITERVPWRRTTQSEDTPLPDTAGFGPKQEKK